MKFLNGATQVAKKVSVVFVSAALVAGLGSVGMAGAASASERPVSLSERASVPDSCKNKLVGTLLKAGFRGENLREAWSIAMRESGGREFAVSPTNDYGLFQFNKASFSHTDWWDEEKILDADYNAAIAYDLSKGGKTWYLWGLTGKGEANAKLYKRAGWSNSKVHSHIIAPYEKRYKTFPEPCMHHL